MKKLNNKMIFSLVAVMAIASVTSAVSARGNFKENMKVRQQWYLSTTVSVYDGANDITYTGDNPVVVGKLSVSKAGHDMHDITPFKSLANDKAAVVIVQDNWGDRSGEYLSSYHSTRYRNDDWTFSVVSTVPYGEVTLDWSGLVELTTQKEGELTTYAEKPNLDSPTLDKLHLIDLQTSEVIDVLTAEGALNKHSFFMGYKQQQRSFRWVLGPVKPRHFVAESSKVNYIKTSQQKIVQSNKSNSRGKNAVRMSSQQTVDKFGLPPQ